jgi:hypothetical protein
VVVDGVLPLPPTPSHISWLYLAAPCVPVSITCGVVRSIHGEDRALVHGIRLGGDDHVVLRHTSCTHIVD